MLHHRLETKGAVWHQDNLLGAQEILENSVGVVDEGHAGLVVEHIGALLSKPSQIDAEVDHRVVGTTEGCIVEVLVLLIGVNRDESLDVETVRNLIKDSLVEFLWEEGLDVSHAPEASNGLASSRAVVVLTGAGDGCRNRAIDC